MEQLEKEDSTIEQLEYYQSDQCDALSIRLIPLSKADIIETKDPNF